MRTALPALSGPPVPAARTLRRMPALLRLALGDFAERSRRPGFLVMLVCAAWAAHGFLPPNGSRYATLEIDGHRALYSSGYVGVLVAMLTTLFFGLAGFYLVKDAIERDRLTRVGEVLAATRVSSPGYLLAKALSNFLVLASLTGALAVSAAVLQLVRGEDAVLRPLELLAPFVWITLPYMAVVGAVAVLFEAIPGLRGGLGNVVWFFLWVSGVATGATSGDRAAWRDPAGITEVMPQIVAATSAAFPNQKVDVTRMSVGVNLSKGEQTLITFPWRGMTWSPRLIAGRAAWFAVAAAIALAAAIPFDRFDTARGRSRARRPRGRERPGAAISEPAVEGEGARSLEPPATPGDAPPGTAAGLDRLPATRGFAFAGLVAAEVRLALRGLPRAWSLVALGLVVVGLVLPLPAVRMAVSPLAWIWPMLIWSALGTRDVRSGTAALLDASPRPLARQLAAAWLGGAVVAVLISGPVGVRLLLAGEAAGALAWFGGVLAVPALALACGTVSGTPRLFEALYLVLWYMGPTNRVAAVDFGGGSVPSGDLRPAFGFLIATLACLGLAHAARARRMLK